MESVFEITKKIIAGGNFRLLHTGHSYEGRRIDVYTCGSGPVKVFAWSQMHGNEPTSTLALLDAMKMLQGDNELQSQITLTAIPMLNPDGYARYDRRNAQGIDVNRDAQSLISPEAKLLMKIWEESKPDFALNLHDQETRYIKLTPPMPTLLAMLAPECSPDKALTPARIRAIKVIAGVATMFSAPFGRRIARYDDVYTPSAFGDTFMRLGTSSILIEAGTQYRDPDRETPRSAMATAIYMAMKLIGTGDYNSYDTSTYDSLPLNMDYNGIEMMFRNVSINDPLGSYKIDIGIRRVKKSCNPEDFIDDSTDYLVLNIGDLASMPAVNTADLNGYTLHGDHNTLRAGCNIKDVDFVAPDGSRINGYTLLRKNCYHFGIDQTTL